MKSESTSQETSTRETWTEDDVRDASRLHILHDSTDTPIVVGDRIYEVTCNIGMILLYYMVGIILFRFDAVYCGSMDLWSMLRPFPIVLGVCDFKQLFSSYFSCELK